MPPARNGWSYWATRRAGRWPPCSLRLAHSARGARIAALAGPSEVLVSQTVQGLVSGSGLVFEDVGERELRGIPDRWHLYRAVG